MMGKCLSETCWADLENQQILLFVASSWFWFCYIAYTEDARSNTNQIYVIYVHHYKFTEICVIIFVLSFFNLELFRDRKLSSDY
jgi:hypothetical protein